MRWALAWVRHAGRFLGSFGPGGGGGGEGRLRAFREAWETRYGAFHPRMVDGSLFDALARARREVRFVVCCIYFSFSSLS